MPYYGFVEVEVRVMREGFGMEGKEVGEIAKQVVRIELHDARAYVTEPEVVATDRREVEGKIRKTIKAALDFDAKIDMQERWRAATGQPAPNVSAEKMAEALEALERR